MSQRIELCEGRRLSLGDSGIPLGLELIIFTGMIIENASAVFVGLSLGLSVLIGLSREPGLSLGLWFVDMNDGSSDSMNDDFVVLIGFVVHMGVIRSNVIIHE